ncbi:AMP-binding protein [Pseudomonas paraeruginosa]|nr:AMP-binding protein [Pseudomonas aeruginosa]VTS64090.1 putative AMP-dependent synthetase and ligase [Streptococcus dysgalactiae subsp. equisimilis]
MSTAVPRNAELHRRLAATPSPFDLLAATVREVPQRTALECLPDDLAGAPQALSYRQLLLDVQRFAAALRATGIRQEEAVAILLPFVPQAVVALLAASAVVVAFPVNLLLSAEAIRTQLELARCRVVVCLGPHPALDVRERVGQALAAMAGPPLLVEVPLAGATPGALCWNAFIARSASGVDAPDAPERLGALVHTGGSTGQPRLARLSLRNMASAALMAGAGLGIRPEERLLSGLPLFHVGGAIDALLAALAVGATLVFPTALGMRNPAVVRQVWQIVARYRITLLAAVPTSLAAIRDSPLADADLSQLRALMTGGSPLPEELARHLRARTGKPIYQLYGMTESSGIASAQLTSGQPAAHAAGVPVPGVEIALGEPGVYRPGAKGEILVRGPNVFHGYLTAQGVVDDPRGGWLASGDLGEVTADGELRIVGRSKDVIIRSGHNIDPLLIEETAHQHPDVAQAAAVAMPDDYAGEVPVLFVVARAGAQVMPGEIATFVAQRIAEPPARPRQVFVLDELPLTPFGKIARFRLRQRAVEQRVGELLAERLGAITVSCDDPAARRVTIGSGQRLEEPRRAEIERLLQRFDLQLEIRQR